MSEETKPKDIYEFELVSTYGTERFRPRSDVALEYTALLKQKTLTRTDLNRLQAYLDNSNARYVLLLVPPEL